MASHNYHSMVDYPFSVGGNATVNINNQLISSSEPKNEVRDWLLRSSPVNQYAIQHETFDELVPEACNWILRELGYEAWLNGTAGKTLYCTGLPATGKTFLSSYVVNRLKEHARAHDEAVIFVYCRYFDSLSISAIFSALLGQLATQLPTANSNIHDGLYRQCMAERIQPTESLLVSALHDAFQAIAHTRVFIVIDALDELRVGVRERLVDILLTLNQSLFLTSRPIPITGLGTADISIQARPEDIRSFILASLPRMPRLASITKGREKVIDEIVQEITSKSSSNFLVTALELSALDSKGPVSVRNLRQALHAQPQRMDDFWALTLKRIMEQSVGESELACRALLWANWAGRPLTISELLEALSVEEDSVELDPDTRTDKNTLITVCCGLLIVEEETALVQLAHYTLHDFLTTYRDGPFRDSHMFALTICAIYLSILGAPTISATSTEYDSQALKHDHPFAAYACRYIGYHADNSAVQFEGEIPLKPDHPLARLEAIPLSRAADIQSSEPVHYGSLVHFSALHGISSTFKLPGQDFDQKASHGGTPLLYASMGGYISVVELLLKTGVNVNVQDQDGYAPLHQACRNGHEAVVRSLLASPGIDPNLKDNSGLHALHHAAMQGHEGIIRALLGSPGVDINAHTPKGETPLRLALLHGHKDIFQTLVRAGGLDLGAQDDNHETLTNDGGLTDTMPGYPDGTNARIEDASDESPLRAKDALPTVMLEAQSTTLVTADSAATFINNHYHHIRDALERLRYDGCYLIQAGFNEDLLEAGVLQDEVYLFLSDDLPAQDSVIHEVLDPIFTAPTSATICTPSRTIMIPPIQKEDVGPENPVGGSLLPGQLTTNLNGASPSQTKQELDSSSNSQQDHGSSGSDDQHSSRRSNEKDEEGDESNERDKQKGREGRLVDEQSELRSKRKILRSTLLSQVELYHSDGAAIKDNPHFALSFDLDVTFSSNPRGEDPPPDGISVHGQPWCAIDIKWLMMSSHPQKLHGLQSMEVSLDSLRNGSELRFRSPVNAHDINLDLKTKEERMKRNNLVPGALEHSSTVLEAAEVTHTRWPVSAKHIMKTIGDDEWFMVITTWRHSESYREREPVFSETISGPRAILEFVEDDYMCRRKLKVSIHAVWSALLPPRSSTGQLLSRLSPLWPRGNSNRKPPSLPPIFVNFIQKLSFEIDLDKLPLGVSKIQDPNFLDLVRPETFRAVTPSTLPKVEKELWGNPQIRLQVDRAIEGELDGGNQFSMNVSTDASPRSSPTCSAIGRKRSRSATQVDETRKPPAQRSSATAGPSVPRGQRGK